MLKTEQRSIYAFHDCVIAIILVLLLVAMFHRFILPQDTSPKPWDVPQDNQHEVFVPVATPVQ